MAGVAQDLWINGRLQGYGFAFGTETQSAVAREWSPYGIGMSLLMAPLSALQSEVKENGAQWLTVANPLVLATSRCCALQGSALPSGGERAPPPALLWSSGF